jgi:hypothetical protein
MDGSEKRKARTSFQFPREPLLIQIERRCTFAGCGARNQLGLTKAEVIEYRGFVCSLCNCWCDDWLLPQEIPSSWSTGNTQ